MGPIQPENTSPGAIYQFKGHRASAAGQTYPHLIHFVVLIPKDQVVRSEMEGADIGGIQLGTDDPLDLFRNGRSNKNSTVLWNRRSRMRAEADLCDSNFVHAGTARESRGSARAPLLLRSTATWIWLTQITRHSVLGLRPEGICLS